MTNEKAIDAIKHNYPSSGYTILKEALDMAIVALQPTDTDVLREALEKKREESNEYGNGNWHEGYITGIDFALSLLNSTKTQEEGGECPKCGYGPYSVGDPNCPDCN